jgi:MinD superfamily P-loop ATPase
MKQLVILSGKGGTGKTTVAAALAHLASEEMLVVLADADVDAANLELVLDPTKLESAPRSVASRRLSPMMTPIGWMTSPAKGAPPVSTSVR